MSYLAHNKATGQLQDIEDDVRLVIAHPNYAHQHRLLHGVLSEAGYVRFEGLRLQANDLRDQLETALAAQDFALNDGSGRTLILDECDRAVADQFDKFLTRLLDEVGDSRIIILTRITPLGVLASPELRQRTRFVPALESQMLWDYAQRNESGGALLEVRALGTGRVQLNGRVVDSWDGVLPRSLFFYLVDRGLATRTEIFETFWPNLTTREATNVFHVTKRKISEVLGMDLTIYWSGFYHISPRIQLSYDVSLFTQMMQDSAVAPPAEAAVMLEEAIALFRGKFLTSLDMKWVIKRRHDLYQMYGDALMSLGRIVETMGKPEKALGLYLQAAVTNPQREDVVQSIMTLYREMGLRSDAIGVYQRLVHVLEDGLGVSPAPHLQELASAIRAELG